MNKKVTSNQSVVRRWKQAQVLLVDEVSMLSGHMLELLDAVARRARGSERPMGGLQVVFCGDFFQVYIESNIHFLLIIVEYQYILMLILILIFVYVFNLSVYDLSM